MAYYNFHVRIHFIVTIHTLIAQDIGNYITSIVEEEVINVYNFKSYLNIVKSTHRYC